MPPQITFVKLTSYEVIPLKIFVKRKVQDADNSTKSLAINSKSLITLNNHNNYQTKLSTSYLTRLIDDILGSHLKKHLLTTPISEIVKKKVTVINYKDDKISVKMVIDVQYLIALRVKLGKVDSSDWLLLGVKTSDELYTKYALRKSGLGLMRWETGMKILIEDEEDNGNDQKKDILYSLKKVEVLGDLERCVKVFLVS